MYTDKVEGTSPIRPSFDLPLRERETSASNARVSWSFRRRNASNMKEKRQHRRRRASAPDAQRVVAGPGALRPVPPVVVGPALAPRVHRVELPLALRSVVAPGRPAPLPLHRRPALIVGQLVAKPPDALSCYSHRTAKIQNIPPNSIPRRPTKAQPPNALSDCNFLLL